MHGTLLDKKEEGAADTLTNGKTQKTNALMVKMFIHWTLSKAIRFLAKA